MLKFILSQESAGSTQIAAATLGKRHKVFACSLSPKGGGISYVKFRDGTSDLMGQIRIPGGSVSCFNWQGPYKLCETATNSPLFVVSDNDGYAGIIWYMTEP